MASKDQEPTLPINHLIDKVTNLSIEKLQSGFGDLSVDTLIRKLKYLGIKDHNHQLLQTEIKELTEVISQRLNGSSNDQATTKAEESKDSVLDNNKYEGQSQHLSKTDREGLQLVPSVIGGNPDIIAGLGDEKKYYTFSEVTGIDDDEDDSEEKKDEKEYHTFSETTGTDNKDDGNKEKNDAKKYHTSSETAAVDDRDDDSKEEKDDHVLFLNTVLRFGKAKDEQERKLAERERKLAEAYSPIAEWHKDEDWHRSEIAKIQKELDWLRSEINKKGNGKRWKEVWKITRVQWRRFQKESLDRMKDSRNASTDLMEKRMDEEWRMLQESWNSTRGFDFQVYY